MVHKEASNSSPSVLPRRGGILKMISPTMNVLLQGILVTSFLTATAVMAAHQCPSFTGVCTEDERPGDCPDGTPCCRVAQEEGRGDVMVCMTEALYCPNSWFQCSSQGSVCSNKGLCCNRSNIRHCECLKGFEGTLCQYKRNDGVTQAPPRTRRPSTKQQENSRDSTTRSTFAEITSKDQKLTARESSEQPPSTSIVHAFPGTTSKGQITTARESNEQPPAVISIGFTTLLVGIAVGALLCIVSVVITGLVFKRKCGSVATGIKTGDPDAVKKYQNLRTTHLNGNGEIADHYDTLELYDKGYDTIDEYSSYDPNCAVILNSEYLQVIAETDDYDDTAQ